MGYKPPDPGLGALQAIATVRVPNTWLVAIKTRALIENVEPSLILRRLLASGAEAEDIELTGLGHFRPKANGHGPPIAVHSPATVEPSTAG